MEGRVEREDRRLTLAEFHFSTAAAAPMYGNFGIWPCVCHPYRVIRPFAPSEHASTERDRDPSS